MAHPVQFRVDAPLSRQRIQVAIRLAILLALGAIGYSSIGWLLYLALPATAALLISQQGGAGYVTDSGPRIVRGLGWLSAAAAYLWLLTDEFPSAGPGHPVALEVEQTTAPTAGGALLRLLYSLPALLLALLLNLVLSVVWVIGALWILAVRRMPEPLVELLTLALRFKVRFAAYHLALVDRYPSFEAAARPTTAPTPTPA
jgi:hypothetical protein